MRAVTRPWLLLSVLSLVACDRAQSVPVVGPDGSRMFHVSCGGVEARCFELAGSACPDGYEMASTPGRNYLVRCRTTVYRGQGVETLAPSPYGLAPPALANDSLAPNPYRTPTASSAPLPPSTASFPPLAPAPPRTPRGDVGY